jgi:hypothetical protein
MLSESFNDPAKVSCLLLYASGVPLGMIRTRPKRLAPERSFLVAADFLVRKNPDDEQEEEEEEDEEDEKNNEDEDEDEDEGYSE